jgi:hypothetical protein
MSENFYKMRLLSILTALFVLLAVILACSTADQAELQTQVAGLGKTVVSGGGEIVQTQANKLKQTAQAYAVTQAINFKNTAVVMAETQAAGLKETANAIIEKNLPINQYQRQFENTSKDDDILTGAYYYSWYGPGRNHWEDGYAGHPVLGEYDSGDAEVINKHIDWATGHGIDFFAVSWWGPNTREDQVLQGQFVNSALINDIQFAILYESSGRLDKATAESIQLDSTKNVDILLKDFTYLQTQYFNNPHYLKIDGRPVVFIYLTRIFTGDVATTIDNLRSAMRALGSDVYLVGDEVYWGNSQSLPQEHIQAFDAVTAYNMHTSVAGIADNYNTKVKAEYTTWKSRADVLNVAFIPGIIPGFDDTSVRPEANHPPIPRSPELFANQIDTALSLLDSRLQMFMITSWNEWHEDTSTEPAEEFQFAYLDVLQDKLMK